MKSATINSSELGHRWDARYHLLHQRHKAAAEELFEKYTLEELVELAKQLPYNKEAAVCILNWTNRFSQAQFEEWLEAKLPAQQIRSVEARRREIAVYCAAAAQGAASVVLEEILEERKKQLGKIRDLKTLLARVKERGCEALHKAIKGVTDAV